MATVQGIRERIGQPVIDAFRVPPGKQLREIEPGSTLKFFVNVQGKTKLETNLQSASLLPHYNTFEARAMRVVISDLPPEYSDEPKSNGEASKGFDVTDENGNPMDSDGHVEGAFDSDKCRHRRPQDRSQAADGAAREGARERGQRDHDRRQGGGSLAFSEQIRPNPFPNPTMLLSSNAGPVIILSVTDLEGLIASLEKKAPPLEQIRPNDGAGNIISKFIFNTVTTLFVGEKIMIEMPTWYFPGGAGPYSFTNKTISHGEPSPLATFRFAEAVFIDKQQNFRVEIDIPDSDVHKSIGQIYGPLFVWVVLDGYLTRDVQ